MMRDNLIGVRIYVSRENYYTPVTYDKARQDVEVVWGGADWGNAGSTTWYHKNAVLEEGEYITKQDIAKLFL